MELGWVGVFPPRTEIQTNELRFRIQYGGRIQLENGRELTFTPLDEDEVEIDFDSKILDADTNYMRDWRKVFSIQELLDRVTLVTSGPKGLY